MHDKHLRVLLIEDNPGDARLVQEMLSEANRATTFKVHWVEKLLTALDSLAKNDYDVALVDLSLPDSQGTQSFTTIKAHAPNLPIVVLSGLDSESMALEAVHDGVQDYLVKGKLTADLLVRALEYAVVRPTNPGGHAIAEKGAFIGILASKGGVGATTVACHFAAVLQQLTRQKVLLVDLDVSSVAAGFLLKVKSPQTILEAATNLHRLDAEFWKSVVCSLPLGFDFLQSPGAVRFGDELNPDRVRHVLRFARSLYQWIVVDLGQITALSANLLQEMRELYLVTTDELQPLFESNRLVKHLLQSGFQREQVRLVLNRYSGSTAGSPHDIENALGYPIYGFIPEHAGQMQDAYSKSHFMDEGLLMHKEVNKVVAKSLGMSPPAGSHGFFNFIHSRTRSLTA